MIRQHSFPSGENWDHLEIVHDEIYTEIPPFLEPSVGSKFENGHESVDVNDYFTKDAQIHKEKKTSLVPIQPKPGPMDSTLPGFFEEVLPLYEKETISLSWQKLCEDQIMKNSLLQKELETCQAYLGFCSEVIPRQERKSSSEDQRFSLPNEKVLTSVEPKSIVDFDNDEFSKWATFEYPQIQPAKIKQCLDKKKECASLLRESGEDFSKFTIGCVEKIVQRFLDEKINLIQKQEVVKFMSLNIQGLKEILKSSVDDEMKKFLEKTVKGRNRPLPDDSKKILKTWFLENFKHPYPTEDEKEQLMTDTQLSKTQINNWFINKRVRVWRPLIKKLFPDSKGLIKANKEKLYLNKCENVEQLSTSLETTL